MGKGGTTKQQVTEYRASIHLGVCTSADAITRIVIGEKIAWEGRHEGAGTIAINRPDLFGGVKKEGGVVGTVYVLPGDAEQVLPSELAARMGLAATDCPAYRGLLTLFFVGNVGNGFYWGTTPFIQPMTVQVERMPVTDLDPAFAVFTDGTVNPAHIIYESLTEEMGAPAYQLGNSFADVAEVLWAEAFGLAMIWTRQAPIEDFVGEVLDHIQATVYVNPQSGLFEIKLLRDDFDVEALPELDEDNCNFTSFDRKMWGETANEIVVSWTNPENEQEETVVQHDLANIVNQGSIVSDSRNYYAVRNAELAARLAARDSRASAAPLALVEAEALRNEWDALPGELRRVTWATKGLFGAVMRVMKVKNGAKGGGKIRVSLMEDVFSLSRPRTLVPPGTAAPPITPPAPIPYAKVITLPMFFATQQLSGPELAGLAYPEVVAGVLGSVSDGGLSMELYYEEIDAAGASYWVSDGEKALTGRALLEFGLPAEAETVVLGNPLTSISRGPEVGSFVVIGDGAESEVEIALIASSPQPDTFILQRGVLDTVPRSWVTNTPVWFLQKGARFIDSTIRAQGEAVDYKLLTRSGGGQLAIADAPVVTGTLTARPHLPLRPANVKVNGVGFGAVNATVATELLVTWANRNRLFEDGQAVPWTLGSIAPEYLQETVIVVFREDATEMFTVRGLYHETEYTIPMAWVEEEGRVFVRVMSERQGLRCLQSHGLYVNLPVVETPGAPPASPVVVGDPPPPPAAEPAPDPGPASPGPQYYEDPETGQWFWY